MNVVGGVGDNVSSCRSSWDFGNANGAFRDVGILVVDVDARWCNAATILELIFLIRIEHSVVGVICFVLSVSLLGERLM